MTVLTFSRAQLSPVDLAAFDAIATPNLERGLWSGIRRRTGRDYDRLLVTVPQIDQVLFSFERDREGGRAVRSEFLTRWAKTRRKLDR